ncbi:MAG TPA: amino acid racemase [Humisphaera sp.]|jgi:aspartate racemase|nr:amino acid racemase [Humisphaera sp.]
MNFESLMAASQRLSVGLLVILSLNACTAPPAGTAAGSETERPAPSPIESMKAMKTIGVLGGLGPQATMDFEQRVHRAAQRVIPPHLNGGYPPMVVWYCRHPPVLLTEDGRPLLPLRADPRLLEAARRLGQVADFLVIPSNTPHAVQPEIERAAGRPVVSMVGATLDEVRRRGWKRVGVVALGQPIFYTEPLGRLGVACETLDAPAGDALDRAIFRVMEGREGAQDTAAALAAVKQLRGRRVDGIILGCTEVPLLLGAAADEDPDLLNPAELLASAAVSAAMQSP